MNSICRVASLIIIAAVLAVAAAPTAIAARHARPDRGTHNARTHRATRHTRIHCRSSHRRRYHVRRLSCSARSTSTYSTRSTSTYSKQQARGHKPPPESNLEAPPTVLEPEAPPTVLEPARASEGAVVSANPSVGGFAPSGGWHVLFADGFGGSSLDSKLWVLPEDWQRSFNSDELEVWNKSQVKIGPNGLELIAEPLTNAGGTGKNFVAGYAKTTGKFSMRSFSGATYAIEVVSKWPKTTGEGDPAAWIDGNEGGIEQEIDAPFEALGWSFPGSTLYGVAMPQFVGGFGNTVYHNELLSVFGFDPTTGFHRYTTVIEPAASGKTRAKVFIDGVHRWDVETSTPGLSVWQHIILSYALRQNPENMREARTFGVRSMAVYGSTGASVQGGGVAAGTTIR